jgi:maleylpyruvate isomerase
MRLYNYWRSSASWRARIALAYKGIPFEYRSVDLVREGGEQNSATYVAEINPLSQVPVLELEDGRRIAQSLAILEYLEERYPEPALLPSEPWLRARARQLAEMVNAGIQPFQNTPTTGYVQTRLRGDIPDWLRFFLDRGLRALERTARETAGTFLVGSHPTFADVCLVPQLYSARRFDIPLAPFPTLVRVEAACNALPAFTSAHPDRQPDAPRPQPHRG